MHSAGLSATSATYPSQDFETGLTSGRYIVPIGVVGHVTTM